MNIFCFRCFGCQRLLSISHHGICSYCYQKIPQTPYCGRCGAMLVENNLNCGNCLREEPKWHRLVRVGQYQPPLSDWIHHFKFHHSHWFDQALARLLLLAIKRAQREHHLSLPEVIIPVPLFWLREWQRNYNQSELLAYWLSKWLNIPLDRESLKRIKSTPPQVNLSASERRRNLKKAFIYHNRHHYRRVAIVDDVVTTGSTMNQICLQLLKAKVEEIQIWTLCRA